MTAEATKTDAILDVLRSRGVPMRPSEIAQAIESTPNSVSQMLRVLAAHDQVENVGHGKWRIYTLTKSESGSETKQQKDAPHILHIGEDISLYDTALPTDVINRRLAVISRISSTGQPTGDGVLADRDEVELRAGAQADKLGYYTMPGDAMEGVISPGAPLDVVPGDFYSGPGIYMLILDGRPTVGHLQGKAGGTWRISYANPAYEGDLLMPDPETRGAYVAAESGLPVTFQIVGQVRGTYRRIG